MDAVTSRNRVQKLIENRIDIELLTTEQLADRLQVSCATIRKWRYEEKIPAIKVGRLVRYDWREVQKWLNI